MIRTACLTSIALIALCTFTHAANSPAGIPPLIVDNFEVGEINSPQGVLDTSIDGSGPAVQIIARDSAVGFSESDVLSGRRQSLLVTSDISTSVPATAQLSSSSGDGTLLINMGDGSLAFFYYDRADRSPLPDIFGSGLYRAFEFDFLQVSSPALLTISLRGNFPEGGGQLFARTNVDGPGKVVVPFDLLEGEFGGPTGPLGVPYQIFFGLNSPSSVSTTAVHTYEISNFQLQPVPEPSTIALCGMGLAGFVCYRRRAIIKP